MVTAWYEKNDPGVLPNGAELTALARALGSQPAEPEASARYISLRGIHVVVKDGAKGGWSLSPSGRRTSARGLPMTVVDTTGAGDSFDAGYLAALTYGIDDESQRLQWATIAGSLSTRAAGGTAAQPNLEELRSYLT